METTKNGGSFWGAWLPVGLWLFVIAIESTDGLSAAHTMGMLARLLAFLHIAMSSERIALANHILRKTGHFIGYGVLSVLFWRAWNRTLKSRGAEMLLSFRLRCAGFALLGTLITASLDEWHQSFIPSRTGTPVDVALDMTGALVAQLVLFAILWTMRRSRGDAPQAYA